MSTPRDEELELAVRNALLAFHDWPQYDSDTAYRERRDSLDELASLIYVRRRSAPRETPT